MNSKLKKVCVGVSVVLLGIAALTGKFVFASTPVLTTGIAENITQTSARLNFYVNDSGADTIVEYGFEYAQAGYVSAFDVFTHARTLNDELTTFSGGFVNITENLSCGTTYAYRFIAINNYFETGYGDVETFTTQECSSGSPVGGVVAHWGLDEFDGTRSDRVSGFDLTDTNFVSATEGVIIGAATFVEGEDQFLSVEDAPELSTGGTKPFSIGAWVRVDVAEGTQVFVSKFNDINSGEWALYYEGSSNRFMFSTYGNGQSYPVAANELGNVETGTWYYLVGTHDPDTNTNTITVNGAYVDTAAATDHADTDAPFVIGAFGDPGTFFARGAVDEVTFFNRVIDLEYIQSIYDIMGGVLPTLPTEITSCHQLHTEMTSGIGYTGQYVLANSLDCSNNGLLLEDSETTLTAVDFIFNDEAFGGVFDGNGYSINLENETTDLGGIGLFSSLEGAEVKDLSITGNINAVATSNNINEIGLLAGYIYDSTITNIEIDGTISITGGAFEINSVGLLAGVFIASFAEGINTEGTILVDSDSGNSIGGVFGYSGCTSQISDVDSFTDVYASRANSVGGVSGGDGCEGPGSTLSNIAYQGTIEGFDSVGGIIGQAIVVNADSVIVSENAQISGNNDVGGAFGNLIASTVTNSKNLGTVSGSDNVGGFVGRMQGGNISSSYADATVDTDGDGVGGFVGNVSADAVIHNAYSRGTVYAQLGNTGGFVGYNEGSIYYTYSTGDVEFEGEPDTEQGFGGFAGNNISDSIYSSFTTSDVDDYGVLNAGGFVGTTQQPGITNSGWVISSIPAVGLDIGLEASRNLLSELHNSNYDESTSDTFKDSSSELFQTSVIIEENDVEEVTSTVWNFEDVWDTDSGLNDGFPFFRWDDDVRESPAELPELTVTYDDIYAGEVRVEDAFLEFETSLACYIQAYPPYASVGEVELRIVSADTGDALEDGLIFPEETYRATLVGVEVGGVYSFAFNCAIGEGETSDDIYSGEFTIIGSVVEEDDSGRKPSRSRSSSRTSSVSQSVSSNTTPEQTTTVSLSVRDLELGMEGEDVQMLQKNLNSLGFTLAQDGAGSPSNETTYFGDRTKVALSKYQLKYGIVPSVGYFGPLTRAHMKGASVPGLWW